MIRRRSKPRRGRVHDPEFLAWLHEERRCAVHGVANCGPFSVHHVRENGSSKDDRRVLGLCYALHLHDYGKYSIERLGKPKWEAHYGISIEAEIQRYNADYALQNNVDQICGFDGSTDGKYLKTHDIAMSTT